MAKIGSNQLLDEQHKRFLFDFISGGIAGAIAKTAAAPGERVKLLLQTDNANLKITKPYKGIIDCLSRTVKEDGFWALWRGNWANVVRYFPTQALNFAFKDWFNAYFNPYSPKNEPRKFIIGNILSGGMAGCTSMIFVYPLDFARTRLGVDIGKKEHRDFKGIWDVISKIYKSDGLRGLYRGMGPAVIGIFIYRGFYFGIYDSLKVMVLDKDSGAVKKFFLAQSTVLFAEGISYPTDTVKRKMMLQSGRDQSAVQYTSAWDCSAQIWRTQGIRGFWRGYLSNILRSVGGSLCLVLYDYMHEVGQQSKH